MRSGPESIAVASRNDQVDRGLGGSSGNQSGQHLVWSRTKSESNRVIVPNRQSTQRRSPQKRKPIGGRSLGDRTPTIASRVHRFRGRSLGSSLKSLGSTNLINSQKDVSPDKWLICMVFTWLLLPSVCRPETDTSSQSRTANRPPPNDMGSLYESMGQPMAR